jgi:hypothetical protein
MRNLAQVFFGWISVRVNIILQDMFGIIVSRSNTGAGMGRLLYLITYHDSNSLDPLGDWISFWEMTNNFTLPSCSYLVLCPSLELGSQQWWGLSYFQMWKILHVPHNKGKWKCHLHIHTCIPYTICSFPWISIICNVGIMENPSW